MAEYVCRSLDGSCDGGGQVDLQNYLFPLLFGHNYCRMIFEEGIRMLSLEQIKNGISIVAGEYPIKKAELFGSYANGSSRPDSDVDLLVEFNTPRVSLLTINGVKYRLEELLDADVDIIHGPLSADSMIDVDRRISLYGA